MKKATTGSGAVPPRRRGRPEGSGVATVTRENILRAAVYCFARSGYAQTSNRDIAQAAGITSGSLYHYFDSKSAIFQEALRQCTLALVETYRAASTESAALSCVDQLCLGLERVIDAAGLLLTLTMGLSISHETDGDEDQFAARERAFERLLRGQLLRTPHEPAQSGQRQSQ